jgi:hypothetical protein
VCGIVPGGGGSFGGGEGFDGVPTRAGEHEQG